MIPLLFTTDAGGTGGRGPRGRATALRPSGVRAVSLRLATGRVISAVPRGK